MFSRVGFVAVVVALVSLLVVDARNAGANESNPADVRDQVAAHVIALLSSDDNPPMPSLDDLSALGPPPWTSYVPGRSDRVVHAWSLLVEHGMLSSPIAGAALADDGGPELAIAEVEPADQLGQNDSYDTGQVLEGFGTGPGLARRAEVSGVLAPSLGGAACVLGEEDGSIGSSNQIDLIEGESIVCRGLIGDGSFGSTGDYDFYEVATETAGQRIIVDISATRSFDEPTFVIGIYAADGTLVRSLRDRGVDPEVFLDVSLEQPGPHYVVVGGCCDTPTDPFVNGSGPPPLVAGPYEVTLTKVAADADVPTRPTHSAPTCFSVETDGSIPLATRVPFAGETMQNCAGTLGDGTYGRTTGDVDVYLLSALLNEQPIRIAFRDNADPFVSVDVVLYDASGAVVGSADGVGAREPVMFTTTDAGDYWVALSAAGGRLSDPFDATSGGGVGWTGTYTLSFDKEPIGGPPSPSVDRDVYLVDLAIGDAMTVAVVGAGVQDGGFVEIVDPARVGRMGAGYSQAILYPAESLLAQFGNISVDHVAAIAGMHAVVVGGPEGDYEARIRVAESGIGSSGDKSARGEQIIFVDFDGASTEPQRLSPFGPQGTVELSPLSASLAAFGVDENDETVVVDEILATITRTLETELRGGPNGDRDQSGVDGDFDITILNSRDHSSPWGEPNVSRIIIGGTQAELGIPTVGISESIDPGNLYREETAVVLLDLLSSQDSPATSINRLAVSANVSKPQLVGSTIGLIAAHEAGHYLGSWHTDGSNDIASVMDTGGDLRNSVGAGPDLIVGTADDQRVSFVEDAFSRAEDFTGRQDTRSRTAHGLAAAGVAEPVTPRPPPRQSFAPNVVPGIIEAEDFDIGGPQVAYNEVDAIANRGGSYRTGDVDIWPTLNQPGGHTVGSTRTSEWLEYTINASDAGLYIVSARVASGEASPGSLELTIDGDLVGAIDVDNTGGWWQWTNPVFGSADLDAGEHVVRLTWTDGADINVDWLAFDARRPRVASSVPGRVQAEDFDLGGQGVVYNDLDPTNRGGAGPAEGVDLWPIRGEPGGITVGTTRDGEWTEYTVDAARGGIYDFNLRVATGAAASGAIEVSLDGRQVGRLAPEANGWWNWSAERVARADLSSGTHVVRLTWVDGAEINLDWFESERCVAADCWGSYALFGSD